MVWGQGQAQEKLAFNTESNKVPLKADLKTTSPITGISWEAMVSIKTQFKLVGNLGEESRY